MDLEQEAKALAERLAACRVRIVLAESCTGGLAAAALAGVPGISQWLCGSAVTYREATKIAWLGVAPEELARHSAVSEQVTRQMATGALARTAEAHLAGAITGHLGPHEPAGRDALVFVCVGRRVGSGADRLWTERHQLQQQGRPARQREAACLLLAATRRALATENDV